MTGQYRVHPNEVKPKSIPNIDKIGLTDYERKSAKNLNVGLGFVMGAGILILIAAISKDVMIGLVVAVVAVLQ